MPTIFAKGALLLATVITAPGATHAPAPLGGCPAHLAAIAPKLQASGYQMSWAGGSLLRAAYVEAAGRVTIEYRCAADGLAVAVINQGLADIPFHVLLAAGPGATLRQDVPDWLREREKAVRD